MSKFSEVIGKVEGFKEANRVKTCVSGIPRVEMTRDVFGPSLQAGAESDGTTRNEWFAGGRMTDGQ